MGRNAGNSRAPKEMSSDRREGFVRAAVKLLRRRGPIRTPDLLALLYAHGISTTEALSVVNHGFSNQLLMRDPMDPAGIAAGPASLPAPSRTVPSPVLQAASTRAVDKRRSHRKKVTNESEPRA